MGTDMLGRSIIVSLLGVFLALAPLTSHSQYYLGNPEYPTQLSNDEVRELMIQMSINRAGKCACPYSPDEIGGICGTECAYYRPGGFKVYCFLRDISSEQVYFWKLKYATPRSR